MINNNTKKWKTGTRCAEGFSLIEVVITLLILSIFMVTLVRITGSSYGILAVKGKEGARKAKAERVFMRLKRDFDRKPLAVKNKEDKLLLNFEGENVYYIGIKDKGILRVEGKKSELLLDKAGDFRVEVSDSIYRDKVIVDLEFRYSIDPEKIISERRSFLVQKE